MATGQEWRREGEWMRYYTSNRFGDALSDAIRFNKAGHKEAAERYLGQARAYGDILSYSEDFHYGQFLDALYNEIKRP